MRQQDLRPQLATLALWLRIDVGLYIRGLVLSSERHWAPGNPRATAATVQVSFARCKDLSLRSVGAGRCRLRPAPRTATFEADGYRSSELSLQTSNTAVGSGIRPERTDIHQSLRIGRRRPQRHRGRESPGYRQRRKGTLPVEGSNVRAIAGTVGSARYSAGKLSAGDGYGRSVRDLSSQSVVYDRSVD